MPTLSIVQERADRTKCLNNTRQIAMATVQLFEEDRNTLPFRNNPMAWGEAAEQLLPYVKNIKEVFDCPANPGNNDKSNCKMPSYDFYTDYEINGYLCSFPGHTSDRRQNRITDYALVAYAYDYPYDKNPHSGYDPNIDRAHEGGINCGYLDGHSAWISDKDMGNLTPPDENTFFHKGHTLWK